MKTKNLRYRVCTFFILCLGIASPQHTYGGNFEEAANSWQEEIKEQNRSIKELKEKNQIKKNELKALKEENQQLGDAATDQVLDGLLQETLAEEKKLNKLEQSLNQDKKKVIELVALRKRKHEDIKRIDEKTSREIILILKIAAVVAAGVVLLIVYSVEPFKNKERRKKRTQK